MLFKPASFFAIVAISAQAALVSRTDFTREVWIPEGQTIDDFCVVWHDTCIALAHRVAKAYARCGAGYDGPGSARVDCLAATTPATDFTDKVVVKLGLTYVSA